MRYRETRGQSAECLRLALQYMARHDAGLHPASFAVWYEYAAGINPPLAAELDEISRGGMRLDDDAVYAIYNKHIAEMDEAAAQRISSRVQRIVDGVSDSAAQAGDRASRFGYALERLSEALAQPREGADDGPPEGFESVLQDTRDMQQAIGVLRSRLEHSMHEAERLKREVLRAREEALVDALTGLANRKGFDRAMADCLAAMNGEALSPCLLMIDIDYFKRINDTYGHLFGDKVLRGIGQVLKANVKGKDTAARYGGEEFAVLLPATPLQGAAGLAETLRATIAGGRVKRIDSDETVGNISVSIGLASRCPGEAAAEFIGRADRALYASKQGGRNRVTVADDAPAVKLAAAGARP
jgi:diguanylate cyclase